MALSNLTKVQTLGIGSNIEVVGVITTGQFKSGTSNLHASGVELTNLNVSGIATIGGNVSIGGTLTYQDVTNIDSVGIITARSTIDAQGDVSIADKIIHTGDTNTAIRFPAVDTISFETSGSERVRIKSDGKVGINSTSPTYALEVDGGTQNTVIVARSSDAKAAISFLDNTTGGYGRASIGGEGTEVYITSGTGGGERLRIHSTGKITIGNESSPVGLLHIKEGDSGLSAANTNADTVFIENGANAGITIATPNTNTGYLTFADPEDDNVGQIIYRHGGSYANSMGFFTNAGERLRISSDGSAYFYHGTTNHVQVSGTAFCNSVGASPSPAGVCLAVGRDGGSNRSIHTQGHIQIANGYGIQFQSSSTGAILDDYEEGTWVPVYQNVNTPNYGHRSGRYTKIGRFVYLVCQISVDSGLDTSDGSTVNIGGFPFTGNNAHGSCLFTLGQYIDVMPDSTIDLFTNVRFNGDSVLLHEGRNNQDITYTQLNSSGNLQFACSYAL